MTYTIWKNGTKYEWLIRDGETIIDRSGLIYNGYTQAKRSLLKALIAKGITV